MAESYGFAGIFMKKKYWVFIFIAGILIVLIMVFYGSRKLEPINQVAKKIGMQLYLHRKPFFVLVDKNFPTITKVLFLIDKSESTFALDANYPDKIEMRASLNMNITMGGTLSKSNNSPSELFLSLTGQNKDQTFLRDLNVDGNWDVKVIPLKKTFLIFYQDKWTRVDKVYKNDSKKWKASIQNDEFEFLTDQGLWLKSF